MKGFTIYTFYTGGDDTSSHYPSLAAATKAARELLDWYAERGGGIDEIEIEKCEAVPMTKANLIDILNSQGGSWVRESTVVAKVKQRKLKFEDTDG